MRLKEDIYSVLYCSLVKVEYRERTEPVEDDQMEGTRSVAVPGMMQKAPSQKKSTKTTLNLGYMR